MAAKAKQDPNISQTLPPVQNIQLDNQGLILKLDFMNLTPSDTKVLESLFDYREKLKQKAKEIILQEDQLKIVESRIQQQITELKRIQGEIKNLLDSHDEQEEKKLALMVKIYESMKPDQAAQIFNTLQEDRVLALLTRMKESKSSAIMANMNPSQASHLTDKLLGQKELKQ
jgi:flagellar motility protein MotE (MotC chaperone)